MPERGGPTTWSGISFQARATVYQLVKLLCDRALSDDPIVSVQCEAPHAVDDLVVTKRSGSRVFQTVKEQIDQTPSEDSPWCKMWKAIHQQFREGEFDTSRDTIEIVFPTKCPLAKTIEELQKRSLAATTHKGLLVRLSHDQQAMFNQIVKLVDVTGDEMLGVLKVARVSFLGDDTHLHEHLMAQLFGVIFLDRSVSEAVIDALTKLVLDTAKTRPHFDFEKLRTHLARRGVDLQDPLRMSFKILNQEMAGEPTLEDAQLFFRGFPATWPVIVGRVPVERGCLAKAKDVVLPEAAEWNTKKGLKVHVVVGPRGVGKATMAKQLAVALAQKGFLVGWHDEYPFHPSKTALSE